jgi:hypothetical protein
MNTNTTMTHLEAVLSAGIEPAIPIAKFTNVKMIVQGSISARRPTICQLVDEQKGGKLQPAGKRRDQKAIGQ